MPILHLGVVDIPYVDASGKKSATATTGQVAGWLEDIPSHGGLRGAARSTEAHCALERRLEPANLFGKPAVEVSTAFATSGSHKCNNRVFDFSLRLAA
jgi:hypothetical protein